MDIHAGIDAWNGRVKAICIVNGIKKEHNYNRFIKGHIDYEKTEKFFKNLKLKSKGKLGCVCIVNYFDQEEVLKNFASGCGFKKTEVIPEYKAIYYEALSTYKLKKSDIVWIFSITWNLYVLRGEKLLHDLIYNRHESEKNKKHLFDKLLHNPPSAIYYKNDFEDKQFIKKVFPEAILAEFKVESYSKMALTYAQIMAGEIVLNDDNFVDDLSNLESANACVLVKSNKLHNEQSAKTSNSNDGTLTTISIPPNVNDAPPTPNFLEEFKPEFSKIKNNLQLEKQLSQDYQHFILPKKFTTNNNKINAVGIDIGTTRCCAAVNRTNGIETVALDYKGERLLPSFIAYDEAHIKCGRIVVDRLRYHAESSIFDSKRIIGRQISDIEIDEIWPFDVISDTNKVLLEVNILNEKTVISPESASSSLLKYIKEKSEDFQGKKLDKVVITVPAAFTEAQKTSTLKAAKLAGWEKVELLPEPVAASFAYFINKPIPNNSKILLFDLGGGTLDVCIFKIQNNRIYILSNTGDSKLGGRDFDKILINYFLNIFHSRYGFTLAKNKKYKLMEECQKIKENLSNCANSFLDVEEFDASKDGELISISAEEFQTMTKALMNRIQNTIYSALQTSGYKSDQIDKVLHVGGGSRMPTIKELLKSIFPMAELCCEENPDEVVAMGAAYYAYSILEN